MYRRIINCDEKFNQRLSELSETFHDCGYPVGMVKNVTNKVKGFSCNIAPKEKPNTVSDSIPIRIVSTYGANDFLEPTLEEYEKLLRQTSSFCSINANVKMFNRVYRTAPKQGGLLSSTKQLVKGNGPGPTKSCGSRRCQSCPLMTNTDTIAYKEKIYSQNLVPVSTGSCFYLLVVSGSTHIQKILNFLQDSKFSVFCGLLDSLAGLTHFAHIGLIHTKLNF